MKFSLRSFGITSAINSVRKLKGSLDTKQIARREGERLRTIIIQSLQEQKPATDTFGEWPEWSDLTGIERELEGYRGKKKLIRSSDMFNSVRVLEAGKGVWVGVSRRAKRVRKRGQRRARAAKPRKGGKRDTRQVPRQDTELSDKERDRRKKDAERKRVARKVKAAGTPSGKKAPKTSTANVAAVQEYGFGPKAVAISPAMRRFLFGVLFKKATTSGKVSGSRPGFVVYSVPARPFLRPAAEKWQDTIEESVQTHLDDILGSV